MPWRDLAVLFATVLCMGHGAGVMLTPLGADAEEAPTALVRIEAELERAEANQVVLERLVLVLTSPDR